MIHIGIILFNLSIYLYTLYGTTADLCPLSSSEEVRMYPAEMADFRKCLWLILTERKIRSCASIFSYQSF